MVFESNSSITSRCSELLGELTSLGILSITKSLFCLPCLPRLGFNLANETEVDTQKVKFTLVCPHQLASPEFPKNSNKADLEWEYIKKKAKNKFKAILANPKQIQKANSNPKYPT